jgi:hypothetical protein
LGALASFWLILLVFLIFNAKNMKNIRNLTFAGLLLLAFLAETAAQPREEVVKQGLVEGMLLVPASANPVPVVLLIAGSGPTDRDGNSGLGVTANAYKLLAEGLAGEGIASLRYDKFGVGKSVVEGMKEDSLTFDQYIADAAAWVAYLAKDPRFSRVVIIGHSEGSLVGMVAAQRARVGGFVSLAGPGRSIDQVINQQVAAQPEPIRQQVAEGLAKLKAGQRIENPSPMLASLFRPSVQPYMISWLRYDPAAELAKLTCPMLIAQGATDLQVPESEADLLRKAQPQAQYLRLEGMNHVLKTAPATRAENLATYRQPELPLAEGLVAGIAAFVQATGLPKK